MPILRNIRLLMWRNCVKRRRAPCSSCCECLFPLLIVGIFVALFRAFKPENFADTQYLKDWSAVPNLAGQGFRAANMSAIIAIGAKGCVGAGVGRYLPIRFCVRPPAVCGANGALQSNVRCNFWFLCALICCYVLSGAQQRVIMATSPGVP